MVVSRIFLMGAVSFGYSKRTKTVAAPSTRIITPKTLPEMGIYFHPNHLRLMWERGDFPRPFYLSKRNFG
jgi:hypothetical protein